MRPPQKLFHCFPEKAGAIFREWKLWFSALKDFNDLFEGMPSHVGPFNKIVTDELQRSYDMLPQMNRPSWEEFVKGEAGTKARATAEVLLGPVQENVREKVSEVVRIFCFTEAAPDLAMWGHYADCHKGFVVEFDPLHFLFSDLKAVQYEDERPEVKDPGDPDFVWDFLFIKHASWRNEREYRLITKATDLAESVREPGTKPRRFLAFPSEAVKAVFFGWQMRPETRALMVRDIGSLNIQKFIMEPHRSKFALIETPIDKWKPHPPAIEARIREALRIGDQRHGEAPT
jgi:hypothetical protein